MSRIPLPSNFGDALTSSFTNVMQQRLAQQRSAQQASQFAQDLAVRKQLLQSQLQAAADVHTAAQRKNTIMNQLLGIQSPGQVTPGQALLSNQLLAPTNDTTSANYISQVDPLKTGLVNPNYSSGTVVKPTQIGGNALIPSNLQSMMQPNALKQVDLSSPTSPMLVNQPQAPQNLQQPITQKTSLMDALNNPNDPNYNRARMLAAAAGISVPTPYESPEQKEAIQSQLQQQKAQLQRQTDLTKIQNTAKQKELTGITGDRSSLLDQLKSYQDMANIIDKKSNYFGPLAQYYYKFTDDPDLGRFVNLQADIATQLEKKFSTRGTNLAMKNAFKMKPNRGDQPNLAIGKVAQAQDQIVNQLNAMDKRESQLTGSPIQHNNVIIKRPNGTYSVLSRDEFNQRLKGAQ